MEYEIREKRQNDDEAICHLVEDNWGSSAIVTRGKIHLVNDLQGILAIHLGQIAGMGLYEIDQNACELVLLESYIEHIGIGRRILTEIITTAKKADVERIWLITTNDNTYALRFYQINGFYIKNIHVNTIKEMRKFKPEIPLVGNNNIPIRDEIELEIRLK
ncbi:MAG: GNAT family N-acetyltransferase [Anaerolineaceae bacterium]